MRTLPRQLIKWIRSFHDLNSDALQTKLRAELASFKLPGEIIIQYFVEVKMDVLKGEEGKRVASGARHFRPTSGERLCRVP